MRVAAALLTALLALAVAVAPHHHAGSEGSHACAACVLRAAEEAPPASPDLSPRPAVDGELAPASAGRSPGGAPLGAVPGQSPPAA
jgi:hypothetical protein